MSQRSLFLLFFTISFLICPSLQTSLVAPIFKDRSTRLYTIQVYLQTPLQLTKLHLDLGGSFTWVDCYRRYNSSTYCHITCYTPLCDFIRSTACSNCFDKPVGPACGNDTCALFPENPVTRKVTLHNAIVDSLALTEPTQGQLVLLPDFVFSCSDASILPGLAKGVSGLAALGWANYSLQAQVSTALSSPRCFALCLTGQRSRAGVVIFESRGPYVFSSKIDLSTSLAYTPLLRNPLSTTVITYLGPSDEYFIGLTSIKINSKVVPLNQTLLRINNESGVGGTKLSTATPYTVLESSMYSAFTELFVKESSALNLTATEAVKPFRLCYAAKELKETRVGPPVPIVDLVMQSDDVFWRISAANSMVRIKRKDVDVWCLGFMDGGVNPRTSVVIGGHQMEDNLLQFDLELGRLGFSSSVLNRGTTCANFKNVTKRV